MLFVGVTGGEAKSAEEDVGETGWGWGGARWEWPERETTIEDL